MKWAIPFAAKVRSWATESKLRMVLRSFAKLPRALPLNLRPTEKAGDRGTHMLGRIAASPPRSAIFQREPVS